MTVQITTDIMEISTEVSSKNKKIKRDLAYIPAPPLDKNFVRVPREGRQRCQRRMWVNKPEMSTLRIYLQVTLYRCITLCEGIFMCITVHI